MARIEAEPPREFRDGCVLRNRHTVDFLHVEFGEPKAKNERRRFLRNPFSPPARADTDAEFRLAR